MAPAAGSMVVRVKGKSAQSRSQQNKVATSKLRRGGPIHCVLHPDVVYTDFLSFCSHGIQHPPTTGYMYISPFST